MVGNHWFHNVFGVSSNWVSSKFHQLFINPGGPIYADLGVNSAKNIKHVFVLSLSQFCVLFASFFLVGKFLLWARLPDSFDLLSCPVIVLCLTLCLVAFTVD